MGTVVRCGRLLHGRGSLELEWVVYLVDGLVRPVVLLDVDRVEKPSSLKVRVIEYVVVLVEPP